MSGRSYNSLAHEKRISRFRISDDDLYDFVLRVAYLAHIMQPKPAEPLLSNPEITAEKEHTSRLSNVSGALSSSIFSLGDLFKDSSHRTVKFPERLLKVLEQKLENIAMGKDPAYHDQLFRRTVGVFYGQFKIDTFKRQMKENRKVEELILMFATHATAVLKKEPSLVGDGWKIELNNQIALFVKLLRESLRSMSYVSSELHARLDMYAAKLTPAASTHNDSGYDSSSTSRERGNSIVAPPWPSGNVADMAMVRTVAQLFKVSVTQRDIDQLKLMCTEKAALNDLKTCLKNINAGMPFPGRKDDFDNDDAWQQWRSLETSRLQQLVLAMVTVKPDLAKSTPSDSYPTSQNSGVRPVSAYTSASPNRHSSVSSRRSMYGPSGASPLDHYVDEDDEVESGENFTYIPPNPKRFYKRLLECCLIADLERMLSPEVNDNDEVPLGILSHAHIELINECALRWRIGQPYRSTCFLDLVRSFYERNDVPVECIPEALQAVAKTRHDFDISKWTVADVDYLSSVYGSIFTIFLSALYHAMDALPNLDRSALDPYLSVLEHVRDSGLLQRFNVDIRTRLADVEEQIRAVAGRSYDQKMKELQAAPGVNRALPLLLMTDVLEKTGKLLDKRFPEPLLGQLDLVALVVGVQVPRFIAELQNSAKRLFESSMNGPTPDVPIQDIFALYRRTTTVLGMFNAFCPRAQLDFDITVFFEPYVRQWLVGTDDKTAQWVQAAIAADKFQAESTDGHSSSIVDLFDSLRSPINFLQDLDWSDEYQSARFFTTLAKTIAKAVEQYCRSVEELFMTEMFPRPNEFLQPQKSSAWLEKARQLAVTGEKRVEPFNFQPESCVKLNNVEAARKLLDTMYNQMQADKIADIIENHGPAVPEKVERQSFLFTVKVAIAEGLVPLDSSPSAKLDTFVTLSDEAGNRLAKTRTIYESLNPRWDETFDLSVDKPLWLMVSVRDRGLVGKHDTVGREYLCLDPRRFGDFLTHDVWLNLDSQGRILIRVSMEGEKDDIQFYFGRAFRSLKRSEADMLRIFIDKMSPFIRQCLSRSVLKSLTKAGNLGLDYNKALGGVQALYRSALGASSSEVQIPLPQEEKPRMRPDELTDVEIERAIVPLFDYFDANLQTLNTYLSETAKGMVMTRVWKEILIVIEELLVPPLSEVSSDMKPLSDKEVDIAFKWLRFLKDYFYANGEGPVPLEVLQNQKYRDVVSIRLYYDWHTDALMEECVRVQQQFLGTAPSIKKRVKSVYHQRNLGTIKERKREKQEEKEVSNGETIMRILRMRPGTSEFIAQQLQIMSAVQAEQEQRKRDKPQRKLQRPRSAQPPLPPLPRREF